MGYILAKAIREHEEEHTSEITMELIPFNSFEEAQKAMMDELKELAYKEGENMEQEWIDEDNIPDFKAEYNAAFAEEQFYDDELLDMGFEKNSAWCEFCENAIKWEIIYMS